MSKQAILYDARWLLKGLTGTSNRSGIYFVAYNVLNELLKRDINLSLYCDKVNVKFLKKYLKEYFKNFKFNIITDLPDFYIHDFLKMKKNYYKSSGEKLKQFFIQICLNLSSVIVHFIWFFVVVKRKLIFPDVYFSPAYALPDYIRKNTKIQKYTMLHDTIPLSFPDYSPESIKPGSWFMNIIESLNANDYYFAISNNTKQDFLRHCPKIDENKIYVTLLACNETFHTCGLDEIAKIKTKYNIPQKKYVFSLCTLEPRKNLIRAVKTFIEFIKKNNIQDLYYVLGGGHWELFINELEKEISDLGNYKDKIIRIGYVDDEDLAPLYSGAEWFVYTSMYEGFGLPPLEAMSCGCPVITSNNSSLPEVVGDAGIMIDWDNDEQHIDSYEKYYFNPSIREEYRQKGLERSKQFSWEKCVNQMLKIMEQNNK